MPTKQFALILSHFILSLIFFACIGVLYFYAITDTFDPFLYFVCGVLFLEGSALALNRGNCPLEHVHRRVGDDKRFFDHFFPNPLVPYVVPFFIIVTAIGFLLLYL